MRNLFCSNRKQSSGGLISAVIACLLLSGWLCSPALAQPPVLVGLGDSIGEAVQSADASWRTQPFSYLNLIAGRIGVPFPLPWIISGPFGLVGDTSRRSRIFPNFPALNLAVSGADVNDLLNNRANALTVDEINSETDLVLYPRLGSQIEIAETLGAQLFICWIGNNDALGAAISFDQLDASQLTPVDEFEADFSEIAQRLQASGEAVVFGNIPDVTNIGFLVNRQDLVRFLGDDFGLAEGDYTSIVVMLLIRLGLNDGSLIIDPDFVLDAAEIQLIQERIIEFNNIIEQTAAAVDMPVCDINGLFAALATDPPGILGIPLTNRFLGGLFSLDGVHPSNIGHALIANAFIRTINDRFNTNIQPFGPGHLLQIFLSDPFVDKDGDGQVTGRPAAGFLETLGPVLGISGDENDFIADMSPTFIEPSRGREFMPRIGSILGKNRPPAAEWTREEILDALRVVFGLNRLVK